MNKIRKKLITGIALVEVMVATSVLGVGILGLSKIQMMALKSLQTNSHQAQAVELASSIISQMRSNRMIAIAGHYDKKLNNKNDFTACHNPKKSNEEICQLARSKTPFELMKFDLNEWKSDIDYFLTTGEKSALGSISTKATPNERRTIFDPVNNQKITPQTLVEVVIQWQDLSEEEEKNRTQTFTVRA